MTSIYPKKQRPIRDLTREELIALDKDGVICARGLLDLGSISFLREAIEDAIQRLAALKTDSFEIDNGFSGDVFVWKLHDAFRDIALFSSLPELAQQALGVDTVNFFYEQFFVKRAGSPVNTPWHQDLTFWPIEGSQLISFWITLDSVTKESSGLEFVKGSHRWGNRYKAITPGVDSYLADTDLPEPPDINKYREEYDVVGWDMEPGDVLIFGPTILHGSSGNNSNKNDRRALAFRYAGPDVIYAPRHATMPLLWDHGLKAGDKLSGSLFPQVWPDVIESEISRRMAGPELPDMNLAAEFQQKLIDSDFGVGSKKQSLFAVEMPGLPKA
ncbi:phytanoyl-CoA dioxygenase family protein [Maricurvus nonylphenolicus]|uniref:phytanoyl-CoA dioxygenase family protein n=1 Tax=Maricurvus nonylphenolicus TaxID=1008307 RepID=UPI0036F280AF